MDLHLSGKKALVTGASRGLGYAIAQCLASEGASVVINSRSADKLPAAAQALPLQPGAKGFGLVGDVTEPETVSELVKRSAELLEGLDLLVTNAGGPPPGKFEAFDDLTWQRAIDLSLMSHVRLISRCAALPAKIKRCQRADDYILLGQAADRQPGAIEQRARRNRRLDQDVSAGAGQRRHPVQLHPAGVDGN